MNECPLCYHELVNVIYGVPSQRLIALANKEEIALGGRLSEESPRLYCYGCQEAF